MSKTDNLINRGAAIERAKRMLSEHFDAGVILLTWMEGDLTKGKSVRWGNDYAQKSLISEAMDITGLNEVNDDQDKEEA
jgi:hypothetical protein